MVIFLGCLLAPPLVIGMNFVVLAFIGPQWEVFPGHPQKLRILLSSRVAMKMIEIMVMKLSTRVKAAMTLLPKSR